MNIEQVEHLHELQSRHKAWENANKGIPYCKNDTLRKTYTQSKFKTTVMKGSATICEGGGDFSALLKRP